MTISFELTLHDQRKKYYYQLKHMPASRKAVWVCFWFFELGFLAVSIVIIFFVNLWMGIFIFAAFNGYELLRGGRSWVIRRVMEGYFKRHPELAITTRFSMCLDEEGVSLDQPNERRLWRWTGIHDCRRDQEMISFWRRKDCLMLIPLKVFSNSDEAEQFYDFAKSQLSRSEPIRTLP